MKSPSLLTAKDDRGSTLLHQEALAGSVRAVTMCVEAGADPSAVTNHGMTPLQLAKSLGWDKVVSLLTNRQGGRDWGVVPQAFLQGHACFRCFPFERAGWVRWGS